jgi:protein gp37
MKELKTVEWTERSWNPVTGCNKVSSGCANCYAKEAAQGYLRRWKNPRYKNGFNLTLQEDLVELPMSWKKPKQVFPCSMSDIFHEGIPKEFVLKLFETMNRCSQHTYIVLTKRADYMLKLAPTIQWSDNIWLGVTVEEARYTGRIESLKQTAAVNKFICAEPLLRDLGELNLTGIDWVVVGGESGKDSRPCSESWVKHLRDQCQAQETAFTFKQWGGRFRKRNGSLLQGQYYHEMPVSNQVRVYDGDL